MQTLWSDQGERREPDSGDDGDGTCWLEWPQKGQDHDLSHPSWPLCRSEPFIVKMFSPGWVCFYTLIILDWLQSVTVPITAYACKGVITPRCSDGLDSISWLWAVSSPAEVDDVVNSILFLLSDKSSMTSGVTLPVDGGFLACWPSRWSGTTRVSYGHAMLTVTKTSTSPPAGGSCGSELLVDEGWLHNIWLWNKNQYCRSAVAVEAAGNERHDVNLGNSDGPCIVCAGSSESWQVFLSK